MHARSLSATPGPAGLLPRLSLAPLKGNPIGNSLQRHGYGQRGRVLGAHDRRGPRRGAQGQAAGPRVDELEVSHELLDHACAMYEDNIF
eukprot:2288232-Heterocapsa_arctica.AAC.1